MLRGRSGNVRTRGGAAAAGGELVPQPVCVVGGVSSHPQERGRRERWALRKAGLVARGHGMVLTGGLWGPWAFPICSFRPSCPLCLASLQGTHTHGSAYIRFGKELVEH